MSIFEAFLLAFAQGITEFIPVSSSGHIVLIQELLGITSDQLTFSLVVHVASALAILLFFLKRIRELAQKLWLSVLIGTVPIVIVGLLFKDAIESVFGNVTLVSFALIFTGAVNMGTHLVLKRRDARTEKVKDTAVQKDDVVSLKQAFLVGCAQAVAITPGISRSGSTVFAGLLSGMHRKSAFDLSFMLALPAIGGAAVLQILEESNSIHTELAQLISVPNIVGFVVAFVVSYFSLRVLRYMIEQAQFWWFGAYCFILAAITLFVN